MSSNNTVYLPWSWTITSIDPTNHTCPSVSGILTTFAIVNGVVSCLSIIFGNRKIVRFTTCGIMGRIASKNWMWMWMIPIGLNLAANALIAWIIRNSAGYASDFKIWELTLFLLARPRLSWILLGFFAGLAKKEVTVEVDQKKLLKKQANPAYAPVQLEERVYNHPVYGSSTTLVQRKIDRPWMSAFLSQFIAEVIMQLAALYIMGRTAHFATIHGFYQIHQTELYKSLPSGAHMMYAGALYYLIAGSFSLIVTVICIIFQFAIAKEDHINSTSAKAIRGVCVILLLMSTFLGSWLFWAGFVELAGHSYCPPKLATHAAVWSLFSTIGVVLGAGT